MAEKHIANAEANWQAVCITPDLCKVGKKVIPFDSYRDLSHDLIASPDVNARGTPVYRITDWVQGTDSNAGRGIFSGTSQAPGHVQIIADDTTVRVNGLICARHESVVLMNNGNTVGKLETDQGSPLGLAENGKLPCNDLPATSPELEQLQALKEQMDANPFFLDQWVRFDETHEILDDAISGIDVADNPEGGWWHATKDGTAQATRATLGFLKDAALGIGQLGYSGGKLVSPQERRRQAVNIRLLMEQIRLGNICLESVKQAAADVGQELAKPVTDAWERGDYVEAITRGGLEIGTLIVGVGAASKAGGATRAAGAAAGKADDVGRATAAGAATSKADDVARAGGGAADDAGRVGARSEAPEGSNGVRIEELPPSKDPRYSRGSFRKGVREQVWGDARGTDGKVRDPLTNKEMNYDEPWDMGHKPGYEHRKHQISASERNITRQEFLDEYNDPSKYRPELPSSNRSHAGELMTNEYFGP